MPDHDPTLARLFGVLTVGIAIASIATTLAITCGQRTMGPDGGSDDIEIIHQPVSHPMSASSSLARGDCPDTQNL